MIKVKFNVRTRIGEKVYYPEQVVELTENELLLVQKRVTVIKNDKPSPRIVKTKIVNKVKTK